MVKAVPGGAYPSLVRRDCNDRYREEGGWFDSFCVLLVFTVLHFFGFK